MKQNRKTESSDSGEFSNSQLGSDQPLTKSGESSEILIGQTSKNKKIPTEHEYEVMLTVCYWAEEEGTYTVTAANREEAEEIAIEEAQDCSDGQMVGCQGFMDGDWNVDSIERTDGTLEEDEDD